MDAGVHLLFTDLQIMLSCLFCGEKHQLISHVDISDMSGFTGGGAQELQDAAEAAVSGVSANAGRCRKMRS